MSSSYHTAAPRAAGAVTLSRFRRDGDQEPAGLARENPAVHAPEAPAPLSSGRSGHDEPSYPPSPSSSGIKGEERNEDGPPMPVGKQAAMGAAMSGNIEQLGDYTGHGSQGSSSEPASSDSHAISAVALLLLAASATSHSELPACKADVSANGSPVANTSSPSTVDTGGGPAAAGVGCHTGGDHPSTAAPASSSSSRAQEAWPTSGHPGLRIAERAEMCSPSLAHLPANDPKPPLPVSVLEEARGRGRSSQNDKRPDSAASTRIIGQQPFAGGAYRYLAPASSQISQGHGSWNRGEGGGYEEPPMKPGENGRAGRLVTGGGGGGVHGYEGGAEVVGRGRWGNPQQQQSTRPPRPCSTLGGPPRMQPSTWRRELSMTAANSLSMRAGGGGGGGGGGGHTGHPVRSPRGKRSPSPPRSAGRKKPEGYRSTTWDGAGRGRKTTTPSGAGGSNSTGGGGGGGGYRRWTPHSARSAGRAKTSGNNRILGNSRVAVGESAADAGFQQQQQQQQEQQQRLLQQRQEAEINEISTRFYEQKRLQQQRLQQEQPGGIGSDLSEWCRKRSRAMGEQDFPMENEGGGTRQKLQPSSAPKTAGQVQWKNGRAAARAAAATTGGHDPRPSKRHQLGDAQKPSTDGFPKVDASRRPLAMDLNMEASGAPITPAAANKGVTGSGRPSPRKKSKNLVWSQFRKACDRCTDKKVRCDGSNPTGGFKACSPCERAGVACLFGICRRSGPRDAHGHKTAAAGVIMKRNDFEKVTERLGQCRTASCRFVNEDGSFWREHFHCRVGDCSFAGKNMSELLLHRGKDHPELPEVTDSSAATVAATAAVATATTTASAASSDGYMMPEHAKEVKNVANPYQRGVLC